jgi:multiple sugar transport system substrate-binding protein
LVAGPPVVRALEELVAAAKLGPADVLEYDPAAARRAFWEGRCGMAISWPSAADDRLTELSSEFPVALAELPGAREAFDVGRRAWDARGPTESPRVPLLSVAGRLGVVGAESPHPEAAFRLLLWFSGDQASLQLCPKSPATTLFRRSQAALPGAWVEPPVPPEAARQYAAALGDALGREQWALALRIPGRAEYLAALDEAVHQAVGNRAAPIEALVQAAARWRDVTARLGPQRQRAAYRASLGLDH